MKLLKKLLANTVPVFSIFYVAGSLMQASPDISKWDSKTRQALFGTALFVIGGATIWLNIENDLKK